MSLSARDILKDVKSVFYDNAAMSKEQELAKQSHHQAMEMLTDGVTIDSINDRKSDEEFEKKAPFLNQKARDLFLFAIKSGYSPSISNLGTFFLLGLGVQKSREDAFICFQKATEATNPINPVAFYNLACHQYDAKNYGSAFKNFKVAANANEPSAIYRLSLCYADGLGTDVSEDLAYMNLQKAAELKDPDALKEYKVFLEKKEAAYMDHKVKTIESKIASAIAIDRKNGYVLLQLLAELQQYVDKKHVIATQLANTLETRSDLRFRDTNYDSLFKLLHSLPERFLDFAIRNIIYEKSNPERHYHLIATFARFQTPDQFLAILKNVYKNNLDLSITWCSPVKFEEEWPPLMTIFYYQSGQGSAEVIDKVSADSLVRALNMKDSRMTTFQRAIQCLPHHVFKALINKLIQNNLTLKTDNQQLRRWLLLAAEFQSSENIFLLIKLLGKERFNQIDLTPSNKISYGSRALYYKLFCMKTEKISKADQKEASTVFEPLLKATVKELKPQAPDQKLTPEEKAFSDKIKSGHVGIKIIRYDGYDEDEKCSHAKDWPNWLGIIKSPTYIKSLPVRNPKTKIINGYKYHFISDKNDSKDETLPRYPTGKITKYDRPLSAKNKARDGTSKTSFVHVSRYLFTALYDDNLPERSVGIAIDLTQATIKMFSKCAQTTWVRDWVDADLYNVIACANSVQSEICDTFAQHNELIDQQPYACNEVLAKATRENHLAIIISNDSKEARRVARERRASLQEALDNKKVLPIAFYDSTNRSVRFYQQKEQDDDQKKDDAFQKIHEQSASKQAKI